MKNRRECGEVVVEASIVVTLVMIVITVMLYIGMILYQQTLVSVMANQTAANIAQVYSNNLKDPFTGYVDPDRVYQSITYSNMKTDAYADVIEQKANVFAKYRLRSSRILATGNTSVEVDLVKKPNELLKSQVVVTIRDSYDIPLVGLFGTNGLVEFGSSGRADCVDVLEYINGVEAIGDPTESNVSFLPDAKTCTITFIPDRYNPSESSTVTVMKGKSVISSNKYTHCVMPSNPTKSSWQFNGWVDESGHGFTASTAVHENIIVYGNWNCTVTLHAEGGLVNSQESYTFTTSVGSRAYMPNAYRTGYSFSGWFTEKGGKGSRYLSNDTVILGDTTLYAHWKCSHPRRIESSRTGTICKGGTIYYKCAQCNADMGSADYPGNGHSFTARCNTKHVFKNCFIGNVPGGCGGYHATNRWCNTCRITHKAVYGYCILCQYCQETKGSLWCANKHCESKVMSRQAFEPSNGHAK